MQIIAYRCYWLSKAEKNTSTAFSRDLEHDFGIENDFRDQNESLITLHDLPTNESTKVVEFINLYKKIHGFGTPEDLIFFWGG